VHLVRCHILFLLSLSNHMHGSLSYFLLFLSDHMHGSLSATLLFVRQEAGEKKIAMRFTCDTRQ
jgi:hypothetical protein